MSEGYAAQAACLVGPAPGTARHPRRCRQGRDGDARHLRSRDVPGTSDRIAIASTAAVPEVSGIDLDRAAKSIGSAGAAALG